MGSALARPPPQPQRRIVYSLHTPIWASMAGGPGDRRGYKNRESRAHARTRARVAEKKEVVVKHCRVVIVPWMPGECRSLGTRRMIFQCIHSNTEESSAKLLTGVGENNAHPHPCSMSAPPTPDFNVDEIRSNEECKHWRKKRSSFAGLTRRL